MAKYHVVLATVKDNHTFTVDVEADDPETALEKIRVNGGYQWMDKETLNFIPEVNISSVRVTPKKTATVSHY